MDTSIEEAKEHFVQGVSRIAHFWGLPKAMGAIFGVVYLSDEPMTLDELVRQVGVSKGAVSTNIRGLERLGLVRKKIVLGDRKDYYVAESDFWKIAKGILREREKNEFNRAIMSVSESISMLEKEYQSVDDLKKSAFYKERMENLKQFFDSLDKLVATFLAIDDLKSGFLSKLKPSSK